MGEFTAFMSTKKEFFFCRKTLAKPFNYVVFFHFWMFFFTIIWTWLSDQGVDYLIFEKKYFEKEFLENGFFENEGFSFK